MFTQQKLKFYMGLLLISILLWSNSSCLAEDWTMFRHDVTHSGVTSDNSVLKFPLSLKWKCQLGTYLIIASSPAIVNELAYIGTTWGFYPEESNNFYSIFAIDTRTGTITWSYETNGWVLSSPTVKDNRVYVASYDGKSYAFGTATNELKWFFDAGENQKIETSPCVVNGICYIVSLDGYLYALDTNNTTGAANSISYTWKCKLGEPYDSDYGPSSSVPAVANNMIYVGYDHILYAITTNGSITGKFTTNGTISSSPTIDTVKNVVYVGSQDDYLYAIDVSDPNNLSLKWKQMTGKNVVSSPAIADGMVYVGSNDGTFYAFDADNQGTMSWSFDTGLDQSISSSPMVHNTKVYFGSENGKIYALDDRGNKLWDYQTGWKITSSPAISDGTLYIASWDGCLYAFHNTPLTITSTSPSCGPDQDTISLTINGDGFLYGKEINGNGFLDTPEVKLVMDGQREIIGTGTQVVDAGTITTMIDLTGARFGQWNVVVTNSDGKVATSTQPFVVKDIEVEVWTYPNPAEDRDDLTFRYFLSKLVDVTIDIYDMNYDLIESLHGGEFQSDGYYEKVWDISRIGSGVYMYVFKAGGKKVVKKLTIVK